MELTGKVIQILPEQSGEGKNGKWRKQDFILNQEGTYPKKVCISLWGDKIDQSSIQEGEDLKVAVNIESREYNGRWYTDVKAWKIDRVTDQIGTNDDFPPIDDGFATPSDGEDDILPF